MNMGKFKQMITVTMSIMMLLVSVIWVPKVEVQAAAPTISVSNSKVTVTNGESTTITVSVSNYTKPTFDVGLTLSDPSVVSITKSNIDSVNHTVTLNIATLKTGSTGVVVYLSNNNSTYTTFTVTSKEKVVVQEKKDEKKDDDEKSSTKKEIKGYKIRHDTHVYGDNGEFAKIKYCDVIEVDDKDILTVFVQVRREGDNDKDKYFKADFYDRNDKLISTKYIYEPNLVEGSSIFLWWEIPDTTKKIKFNE